MGNEERSPHDVMVKMLDYGLKVSELKLQSHRYIYFWTIVFGKVMSPFISSSYGLNSTVLLQG